MSLQGDVTAEVKGEGREGGVREGKEGVRECGVEG